MTWLSWDNFLSFRDMEQTSNSIELWQASSKTGAEQYLDRTVYVCAGYGTGGKKIYQKKHPEWSHKLPGKIMDCLCSLKVKRYHGTSIVLGKYSSDRNHATGVDNLLFTRISDGTRDWIAGLVRLKVKTNHIVTIHHVIVVINFNGNFS